MGPILLPIALVSAGAAAILNVWLALRTSAIRRQTGIGIGDGGNEALIRRMRAHANFIEAAPFIVILIALIEITTGSSLWLWGASVLFVLARIAHAVGMDGVRFGRAAGTRVTFALLLALGGYAVTLPFLAPAVHSVPAVSAVPAG
ncbi:MAPEG family protein [Sphingomonas sp. PAMC 26605]|uniref:MAPEG family protein n=1 Tax=Sphingomonas sp. PAMC 26605 TaxID=1112214 RepID=UPI00026CA68E|nr:MAPEG family protein [Sphingomonas sp. PAMC 26605]